MMVMFGWLCSSVFPSFVGYSFFVMLSVLQMGLREFVHKLATECYQYLCFRPRPPPDPDSTTHPSLVSEGGPCHASEGAQAIGPHHASEGAPSINVIFHYLRPKLMVHNPWHLNERECGSSETEVVSYVGCYVILVGLLYPNWICGLIPYEWKSTFRTKTTFSSISLVFATINFTSGRFSLEE